MPAIVAGAFIGLLYCAYKLIKWITTDLRDNNSNYSYNQKYNSDNLRKQWIKCPKCGNEISKETKNSVAIKCSECGNTFWF